MLASLVHAPSSRLPQKQERPFGGHAYLQVGYNSLFFFAPFALSSSTMALQSASSWSNPSTMSRAVFPSSFT